MYCARGEYGFKNKRDTEDALTLAATYFDSSGQELNIKISDYTRNHVRLIYDIELRYFNYLELLEDAISNSNFDAYNRVFDRFNFGISVRALLLFNIYPFEKFLFQGKPLIEREYNDNDRLQKRDRSLRKFQAFLGMSYSFSDSGKKSMKKFHGSSMIRSHLYAWAVCMVAPSCDRISSDFGKQLSDRYQELRKTVKGKDALIRILFKATRLLYCELVKELVR